jgi:dipeptide/tripeptide permease
VVEDWLEGAAYALVMSVGLFLLIWQGGRLVRALVSRLKESVTHPRTGQVRYAAQPDHSRWTFAVILAAAVLIIFVLPENLVNIPMLVAVILATIMFSMGLRVSLRRLQWAAVVPIAAGVTHFFMAWSEIQATGIVFMAGGLTLLLTGYFALRHYLRNNPAQSLEEA